MADKQAGSIRCPLGMYKEIKELSDKSYRSFNGQTVFLLRKALKAIKDEDAENQLLADELAKKISKTVGV